MTDLVERLMEFADVEPLMQDAADEIGRLQTQIKEHCAVGFEQGRLAGELCLQIERLEAEIKRLRADKDVKRSQERNTAYEKDIVALEAEIERLQAKNDELEQNDSYKLFAENKRLEAEIQDLRIVNGHLQLALLDAETRVLQQNS